MAKKYYKYPERQTKINKKGILILLTVSLTSFTFQIIYFNNSSWIITFFKNPLNIIGVLSLFIRLAIIDSNKNKYYKMFDEQYERKKEEDRINEQIKKNASL